MAAGLLFGKPTLVANLLTSELTSPKKVKEILASKDETPSLASEVIFNNQKLDYLIPEAKILAQIPEKEAETDKQVLGTGDERFIEVILSQQRLNAWEGNNLVYSFLVSTGLWAPTPTGDYRIWIKLASTTMKGGSKALGTYYYLPNVPCTMYFYKGYGIHGTYWHNNFGQRMSHGCINMRTSEACTLFNWASVGTRVSIHN